VPSTTVSSAADEFGRRLRGLRIAAGMSQADLATDGISPSYVSLLESGRRTPTPSTVTTLAAKLGTTEPFLLHGESAEDRERLELSVRYAELALRNGEAADALTHATAALAAAVAAPAELVWRARRLRAEALEAAGHLEVAIPELERLLAEARDSGRGSEALRLTVAVARCYKEVGDVAHALTLAAAGLREVTDLELVGTDAHAELAAMLIGLHYLQGDLARADLLADEALALLGDQGSRRARGSVYWNASLTAEARGDVGKALTLAEHALALFAEDDDGRAIARLRTAYAWLLLRTAPPRADRAHDLLTEARAALLDSGSEVDLAYCETELGRAQLLLGDPQAALELAQGAMRRLGEQPRHESAHAQLVVARALLELGHDADAIAEYRAAAAALTDLGIARQAAAAWRELADAFTALQLFEDAALAYQQALAEAGVRPAPDVAYPGDAATAPRKRTDSR
jgi:transcriptional regulator with XRE-family HTH domain